MSWARPGGYIECIAPALAHARYAVEVSLHLSDFTADGVQYLALGTPPSDLRAIPSEAPAPEASASDELPTASLRQSAAYSSPGGWALPGEDVEPHAAHAVHVTLLGQQLHGGFAYRCRPSPAYVARSGEQVTEVQGSYVPSMRAVRCVLPVPDLRASTVPLALQLSPSLDGEQASIGRW